MPPPADDELLSQFRTERSEAAFRALVERHLPLVWSVARRVVNGDDALAEDVAQTVFADLARKARVLPAGVRLGGWLHRHTFFTASKAVRTEARRRAREIEAAAMNAASTPESDLWREMAPHVDSAIAELAATDRDAIVLRFFEKKPLRDVARMLGISEDAAGKRIARALERLRRNLSRRRVVVAPIIIGGSSGENAVAERIAESLAQNAIAAPPAHLSAAVASGAWSRAGAAAGSGGVLATVWSRVATPSGLAAGVTALLTRGNRFVVVEGCESIGPRRQRPRRHVVVACDPAVSPTTRTTCAGHADNRPGDRQISLALAAAALGQRRRWAILQPPQVGRRKNRARDRPRRPGRLDAQGPRDE